MRIAHGMALVTATFIAPFVTDDASAQIIEIVEYFGSEINFQQGFILNSMAMPAPGMLIIFGFGIADIAVARRRA